MQAQDAQALQQEIGALRAQLANVRSQLASAMQNVVALKESEERYRILSGASLAGVYVIGKDGRIVYTNPQAAAMLGYTPEEIVGRDLLEMVVPESRAVVESNLRRRLEGEVSSVRYSARVRHRNGSSVDFEIFGSRAVFDGRPAIIGTVLDRTEERRAERALRASEARFQTFMDNTPAIAFLKDAEGRFLFANRAFHTMMDAGPDGIIGKTVRGVFPADQADEMVEIDREVLETKRPLEVMRTIALPGREPRNLLVYKFPVEDPEGRLLVGGMAFDITAHKRAEESLDAQRRILQSILDSMGEGVVATNDRGEFVIFNPAAQRITGLGPVQTTPSEWTGIFGLYKPDRTTPYPPETLPLARAMRGEATDNAEMFVCNPARPDGAWLSVTGRPLVDRDGASCGGVVVFRDTSDQRSTLEQLTQAEAKYRALVEQLPVVTYLSGIQTLGPTLYMSPQVQELLGDSPEDWVHDSGMWLRRIHPADRDRVVQQRERAASSGERFVSEYRMLGSTGSLVWVHDEAVVVDGKDGEPKLVQGVLVDITEREKERGERVRLQALSQELVAVQEAERRRIGLELHDEIGQILTGLKLRLGDAFGRPAEELERRLQEMDQIVDEAIVHVRELSQNLRPAVLDDLGLLPALVSYFGRYSRQTGVRVAFEHSGIERRRLAPELETAAYRIVQEALTNVARHAHVGSARVRAWVDDGWLKVRIEDQGGGFDAQEAIDCRRTSGLLGMRERATLLRGRLQVDSDSGRGCRVTGELPIEDGSK